MGTLEDHSSFTTAKVLYIGESGSGKTGSLASLASQYQLFILDFDNGLDILTDPGILKPEFRKNVRYETLTDKLHELGGKIICDNPTAWSRAISLVGRWKDRDHDFGPVTSWRPDRILVIDSATLMGPATLRYSMSVNRKTERTLQMWGDAISRNEDFLAWLYSDAVKCHVIVTAHIRTIDLMEHDEEIYDIHGFPSFLGKQLPRHAGRYFNTTIMAVSRGSGAGVKRLIRTRTEGVIDLKVAAPSIVPKELPLETGMLDLFNILTSKKG